MLVGHLPLRRRAIHGTSPSQARGFTLIELITTVTVMAVLAVVATPSFRQYIGNQRTRNAAYDLMSALAQARSEAIRRNTSVDLTRSASSQPWDRGYKVVVSGTTAPALLNQQAYSSLSITDSSGNGMITYGKDGRALTSTTVFKIAPTSTIAGVTPRCVTIGLSGVPKLNTGGC